MFKRSQFLFLALVLGTLLAQAQEKPRVFIFTDVNINSGDPDDRQSLVHLFWYADELEIVGIVPDRWEAQGFEACQLALGAYQKDYPILNKSGRGYPKPERIREKIAKDWPMAQNLFQKAASDGSSPLYVLIWGNMERFRDALLMDPSVVGNLRVITIGTGVMLESSIPHLPESWGKSPPCQQMNWNAFGRNDIYDDQRFNEMWWLEINWSYAGMFGGPEPAEMLQKLSVFGALGKHLKEAVVHHPWAQYFRVGDTPTVLYMIDPGHELSDPTASSWAGKFYQPFPEARPNFFTDFSGSSGWNYANPCATWDVHEQVNEIAKQTLEERRPEMYDALLGKLAALYKP